MKEKIYVISNSHMDPIWLWRLREGRSTWINTCRNLDLRGKKAGRLLINKKSQSS